MPNNLAIMLKELRLPAFEQYHERYQAQAWGYEQYLATLCEHEIARRFEARIGKWSREAKLPQGKSFTTLAMEEFPDPIQKKVIGLRDNTQWARQADNVLLIGPSWVFTSLNKVSG